MNPNLKNGLIAAGVALVVAFGVGIVYKPSAAALPANVLTDVGAGAAQFGATASSFATTVFSHLSNLEVNGNLNVVGIVGQGNSAENTSVPELYTQVTSGSCAGTASSTQFAILNPFAATSTVTEGLISGTANAFATDFVVGTSTTPGGMTATSSLGAVAVGYIGMYNIASGGQFYTVPGIKVGPGQGYQSPAGGTYTTSGLIVLGPKEYLVGYATSTATTGGIGVKSCTYKFEWQN